MRNSSRIANNAIVGFEFFLGKKRHFVRNGSVSSRSAGAGKIL
jgi:hypothetical protein